MADDKDQILLRLEEGVTALQSALAGLDPSSVLLSPVLGRWSILDCVEHLAASEAALLDRLHEHIQTPASHADPAREARLESLALNRERTIDAPQPVHPAGACSNLAQALESFYAVRARTLEFVRGFPGDLRSSLVQHPLIQRPLNCYEMLLLMALHPIRHAAQIAEIRATLIEREPC